MPTKKAATKKGGKKPAAAPRDSDHLKALMIDMLDEVYRKISANPLKPDAPLIHIMIAKIMKELEPVAKKHRHVEGQFTFRKIDEVAMVLQPLLVASGVFIVPVEIKDHIATQLKNNLNNVLFNTRVKTLWRVYASDGSYIEAETMGEGMSDMQFSTGAAQTMAYKQLLWELFMIPVLGMDPEESQDRAVSEQPDLFTAPDAPAPELPAETGKKRRQPAAAKIVPPPPTGEKLTTGLCGIVVSLVDDNPAATLENLLAHFKVEHLGELFKSQMKDVEDWIAKQGATE